MLEAFLAELAEAGPERRTAFNRLALTLNKASREELQDQVLAILDEFVTRAPTRTASPTASCSAHAPPRRPDPSGGSKLRTPKEALIPRGPASPSQLVHQEQGEVESEEGHQQRSRPVQHPP